jgi:hypothetical protein
MRVLPASAFLVHDCFSSDPWPLLAPVFIPQLSLLSRTAVRICSITSLSNGVLVAGERQSLIYAGSQINLVLRFDGQLFHSLDGPEHKLEARPHGPVISTQSEYQTVFIGIDGVGAHIKPAQPDDHRESDPQTTAPPPPLPPPLRRTIWLSRSWLSRINSSKSAGRLSPPIHP